MPSGAPLPSALHIGHAWRDVAKLENDLKLILVPLAADDVLAPRPYWLAQLRYSAHAMGFEECSPRQKRLALASTCLLAERLRLTERSVPPVG